jgi:aminopeptidase N
MLIQNFFYDTATFVPVYKPNFDSLSYMIDYLSTLYGRYPFYKEKYGVCYTTLQGGMEHQTMTTIGVTQTPLIAHELGHQWFGDCVTYQTWPHVWLSEGFATYTEQIYVAKFWGAAAAFNYRKAQYNNVMTLPGGRVYVDDTTSPTTIFDQRLVYYKAAGVLHMLRFQAPQDSLFFTIYKNYQQQYAFGNATTEDLKAVAESVYGQNLDTFFNQWIYEQGYPTYSAKWNQVGNTVYVQLNQTTSVPTSVAVFFMPLQLELKGPSIDTTIKALNNQATQLYTFTLPGSIDSVFIDPNNWVIHRTGTIKFDSTLSISGAGLHNAEVFPNPSKDYWQIGQLPQGVTVTLMDMDGHAIWTGISNNTPLKVPGKNLPPGNYLLKLDLDDADTSTIKLVHW